VFTDSERQRDPAFSESHGEEGEEAEDDDDEDDEEDEAEEAGEANGRPYNLRQRKAMQRYEAPPIGESGIRLTHQTCVDI
jgi:hypothetical protein